MRLPLVLLAVGFALGACGKAVDTPQVSVETADAVPEIDRDLVLPTAEERVRLADHRGDVLVFQVASAGDADAWSALDDAYPDLAAEGATVMAIVMDGRRDEASPYPVRHAENHDWARSMGYEGAPMAVVIGPAGRLRGRSFEATGDDLILLAAPVLLESEDAAPVTDAPPTLTAESVESLVRSGAALIDVRAEGAPLANAVAIPLDRLRAEVLPPDLGIAIVFVGPDAEAATALAESWGHEAVYALPDAFGLEELTPEEALPTYDPRDDLPRVRG